MIDPSQRDMELGRALLAQAEAGDAVTVERLLAEGAECWWHKIELLSSPPTATIMDQRDISRFFTLSLHNDMKKQNIPLYMAAWHGHEAVVDVFLQRHAYDSGTLTTALYGAVSAGSLPIVQKLLAAGADPLAADGIILRNNLEAPAEIISALIAVADKGQALAIVLSKEKKELVFSLLGEDRELDLRPALKVICQAMNARENVWNPQDQGYYLDMLRVLLGFATGRGDDMGQLINYTMKRAVVDLAAPVIDVLVREGSFDKTVPQRVPLLNLALQTVSGLVGENQRVAAYDYFSVVEKLLEKGADPKPLLFEAAELGHVKFAHLALKHGADPRMMAMLKADSMIWKDGSLSSLTVRDVFSLGVIGLSNDEADFLAGGKDKRSVMGLTPEFLRFSSVKTRHSGLALALMCGEGAPAIEALLTAETPLQANDLLMADRDDYRVIDHVLRDRALVKKIMDSKNWHFRAEEYERVWNILPVDVQKIYAEQYTETVNVLRSIQDQRDLRAKAAAHKNRFKLK